MHSMRKAVDGFVEGGSAGSGVFVVAVGGGI